MQTKISRIWLRETATMQQVRGRGLVLFLALSALGGFSVAAQETATPAESPEDLSGTTFTDIIDVRVVEVEVVVTDKGDRRVSG